MADPPRTSLLGIMGGLMVADNLGDVHDELLFLCDLVGIPHFEGGYVDGWTDADWASIGRDREEATDG